jgi:hypothetical protein
MFGWTADALRANGGRKLFRAAAAFFSVVAVASGVVLRQTAKGSGQAA